jgi:hypothetical protein
MAYVQLRHAHEHPVLPGGPALDGLRDTLVASAAGTLFLLLGAAAAVYSLYLCACRALRRLTVRQ